jgi:putative hydrolase of the HAD superfamily
VSGKPTNVPPVAARGLIMDYGGVLTDGIEMLDLPRRARAAGCPTALVSDADAVPEAVAALFDVLVLGGTVGARKPDPEVYRRTAELMGLPPHDCVVVDDLSANVRGARAAGAVAVLHDDPDTTVAEVEILLALPG